MFIEGGISEIPTDLPGISVSPRGSFVGSSHTQVPSPSSNIISISQDMSGYLDPHRISYGSPGEFDAVPRISSPDDTFPVFSPPPDVI
jgi:piezo-type mechanosensitive ion channel component 1/2